MNDLNQNLTNSVVIIAQRLGEPPSLSGPGMRAFRITCGGGALPSSRTGTTIYGEYLYCPGECALTSDMIERLATGAEIAAAGLVRGARQQHTMCETRDLDDCITEAKEAVVASLEGGANYLRRWRADDLVGTAIHEAADAAVPALSHTLLQVFGSADHLWFNEPECGFGNGEHGVMGVISRVVYDEIHTALYEWASELEADTLVCEADSCENEDYHNERTDPGIVRCQACCGGAGVCERCAAELFTEAKATEGVTP